MERSIEKRAEFTYHIGKYDSSQLVFVDESSWDRRGSYKGRVWALWGQRAHRSQFFVRGRRYVSQA
jgi:hypothetical protein